MTDPTKLNDTQFLEQLKTSPAGREMFAARNREVLEQRKQLLSRLAEIDTESGRDNSEFEKRAKLLFERHEKLKQEFIEVGRDLNAVTSTHLAAASLRTIEQSTIERSLRATAHPAIEQFLTYLIDLFERNRGAMRTTPHNSESLMTGGRVRRYLSNGRAVTAWTEAIIDARKAAEAMLLAADQSDVEQKLAALRDGIPVVQELADEIVEALPPSVRLAPRNSKSA